jgi:hypothetical protein
VPRPHSQIMFVCQSESTSALLEGLLGHKGESGRVTVLVDGMDEVLERAQLLQRLQELRGMRYDAHVLNGRPSQSVCITSSRIGSARRHLSLFGARPKCCRRVQASQVVAVIERRLCVWQWSGGARDHLEPAGGLRGTDSRGGGRRGDRAQGAAPGREADPGVRREAHEAAGRRVQ